MESQLEHVIKAGTTNKCFLEALLAFQELAAQGFVLDTTKRVKIRFGRAYFSVKSSDSAPSVFRGWDKAAEGEDYTQLQENVTAKELNDFVENQLELSLKEPDLLPLDDSFKEIKNKLALLRWAKDRNIEVPEDKKAPSAIKKYLREYVEESVSG